MLYHVILVCTIRRPWGLALVRPGTRSALPAELQASRSEVFEHKLALFLREALASQKEWPPKTLDPSILHPAACALFSMICDLHFS